MKYPLYIIALLSCILFLSCDKTKHEDTWWFDNETENLFTNGLFVNYESTCRVITIGCNSEDGTKGAHMSNLLMVMTSDS